MNKKLSDFINIESYKLEIKKQAFERDLFISDEQMDNLLSEAEEVFSIAAVTAKQFNVPHERIALGAFIAGALFGKDNFRKLTCSVEMQIKNGKLEKATTFNTQEKK